jgi:hypothetical protein
LKYGYPPARLVDFYLFIYFDDGAVSVPFVAASGQQKHLTWTFCLFSESYPICNSLNNINVRFPNNGFLILRHVVHWVCSDVSENFAVNTRLKNNFLIFILNIPFTAA